MYTKYTGVVNVFDRRVSMDKFNIMVEKAVNLTAETKVLHNKILKGNASKEEISYFRERMVDMNYRYLAPMDKYRSVMNEKGLAVYREMNDFYRSYLKTKYPFSNVIELSNKAAVNPNNIAEAGYDFELV